MDHLTTDDDMNDGQRAVGGLPKHDFCDVVIKSTIISN